MVVRTIADSVSLHDGEVVFGLVCIRVFTLAPLRDFLVITHSHDGRPVTLTGVISASADHTIVMQTKRVADFVGYRFRHVFLVVWAELLCEDPGWAIVRVVRVRR